MARVLAERTNIDAAIALLEMNGELHPGSAAFDMQLGDLFMARGDHAKSVARFRSVLKKEPGNARAKRLIGELEAKPN